jgi:hypothetical protein
LYKWIEFEWKRREVEKKDKQDEVNI